MSYLRTYRASLRLFHRQARSYTVAMTSHPEHNTSASVSPLDASRLKVEKNSKAGTPLPPEQLVFGKTFTDHMLTVPWTMEGGWGEPKIQPYAPLTFEPSTIVFHYAPTLFEGLKAYKDPKGNVRLFRPDMNAARMNRSAERLSLPVCESTHADIRW